jgi:hypothetical protein
MKYGYSFGPRVVITAQVADTGTIDDGDIVVLDAVGGATGSGYVKKWSAATDAVVGAALESVDTAPTADGGDTVQVVLALPGTVFVYPASGITQAACFQCCDIDGSQSIDFDADTYQNVWIVDVDGDEGLAYVMFKGPFTDVGASGTIDYGVA